MIEKEGVCRSVVVDLFLRAQVRQQGRVKLRLLREAADLFEVVDAER